MSDRGFWSRIWVGLGTTNKLCLIFGIEKSLFWMENIGDPIHRKRQVSFKKTSASIGAGGEVSAMVPTLVLAHGLMDWSDFEGGSVEFDWDLSAGVKLGRHIRAAAKMSRALKRHEKLIGVAHKVYKNRNVYKPGVIFIPLGGLSTGLFLGWTAGEISVFDHRTVDLRRSRPYGAQNRGGF